MRGRYEDRCHLIILDQTHTLVLVAAMSRFWLLPNVRTEDRHKENHPIRPCLAHLGLSNPKFLHDGLLDIEPRAGGNKIHGGKVIQRYLVYEVSEDEVRPGTLTWKNVDELLEGRRKPVLPLQRVAVRASLDYLGHVPA